MAHIDPEKAAEVYRKLYSPHALQLLAQRRAAFKMSEKMPAPRPLSTRMRQWLRRMRYRVGVFIIGFDPGEDDGW